ncbi:MAG: hypothetical protein AAFX06_25345 [Planctomycetota bacterium]
MDGQSNPYRPTAADNASPLRFRFRRLAWFAAAAICGVLTSISIFYATVELVFRDAVDQPFVFGFAIAVIFAVASMVAIVGHRSVLWSLEPRRGQLVCAVCGFLFGMAMLVSHKEIDEFIPQLKASEWSRFLASIIVGMLASKVCELVWVRCSRAP